MTANRQRPTQNTSISGRKFSSVSTVSRAQTTLQNKRVSYIAGTVKMSPSELIQKYLGPEKKSHISAEFISNGKSFRIDTVPGAPVFISHHE